MVSRSGTRRLESHPICGVIDVDLILVENLAGVSGTAVGAGDNVMGVFT